MTEQSEQATQAATLIQGAFEDAPPPPRPLVQCLCPECEGAERALAGARWREVSLQTLLTLHDALPLLTPEALRYYLPAFAIAALREAEAWEGMIPFSILMIPKRDMAGFNAAERSAMRAFVEYLRKYHAADFQGDLPGRALRRMR